MKELLLVERATTPIPSELWFKLRGYAEFWALVEANVIKIKSFSQNSIALECGNLVGSVLVGDTLVHIRPKIPGALEALLTVVDPAFRASRFHTTGSDNLNFFSEVVRSFLDAVEMYSSSRDWRYKVVREVGPVANGSLDVGATIRLRARGYSHLLGFKRAFIDRRTPLNIFVAGALQELEVFRGSGIVSERELNRSRGLAMLFSDCYFEARRQSGMGKLIDTGLEILSDNSERDLDELIFLGIAILRHSAFDHNSTNGIRLPLAWLINMENLFESAVRTALTQASGVEFVKGYVFNRYLFPGRGLLRVNPDLVFSPTALLDPEFQHALVGDAKYKSWPSKGLGVSDIYQLVSHAMAFEAEKAFLVYPGDETIHRNLESTDFGIEVHGFTMNLLDIPGSANAIWNTLKDDRSDGAV